ncbi:MAG: PKD domain-containing protein, partial [Nitriliruptorales bacterium]|nr:PKD domain-containing protein [Nitriliruptorales bacterium]
EPPAPGGDSTPDGSGTSTPTEDSTPTSTTEPTQSPTTEPTQSPTASEPTDDSTQTNAAPTARYVTSVASGTNEVTFDASSSSDPDGDSLTYTWQFNDGTSAKAGKVVTHQFTIKDMASSGKYVVTLSVDDGQGGSDSVSAPASIKMPDVYGMNTDTAHQAIRGTGLGDPYYSPAWNDTTSYTSYLLWSQWPAADTTLTPSSRTRVVVWEEDSCIAFWETAEADDEWCYEPPPPSPTLDQGYF